MIINDNANHTCRPPEGHTRYLQRIPAGFNPRYDLQTACYFLGSYIVKLTILLLWPRWFGIDEWRGVVFIVINNLEDTVLPLSYLTSVACLR